MNQEKMYTIPEVIDKLAATGIPIPGRTIRYWIKVGKLKAVRPGMRKWFVPAEEMDRLLETTKANARTDS